MTRTLRSVLNSEKNSRYKGGIYHRLQIDFAYNSNHIEGSRLTHEQTRYIYETKTIGAENASVNDIIETVNHFRCFDYILDTLSQPLTEEYIKNLHRILKNGAFEDYAVIGDYKTLPNEVGQLETALPEDVPEQMRKLLSEYNRPSLTLYEIADFHQKYEKIHPFYDGNGRTGRLLMFKQCLENDVIPFFIDDFHKRFYYMGLQEWQKEEKSECLITVFLSSQDYMKQIMDYFRIEYSHKEYTYKEVLAEAGK
ncbi:MAG: Fic family protein [Oscillospiraceae bacterium]|nr:Fic family protein [Oscillospiraceae bacterium]